MVEQAFLECKRARDNGDLIRRSGARDKEFSFQYWFADRLNNAGINHDEPGRVTYPDFTLVDEPLGFELKGLGYPGRELNYDCNSQLPSGFHRGRTIYYVFGRYPSLAVEEAYPLLDLVVCHGDLLNCNHDYEHKNKNFKGFGSYGDIMVRDRKMYVAPTPYALLNGVESEFTLIVPAGTAVSDKLVNVGDFVRTECQALITGYSFDLITNELAVTTAPNPKAGVEHRFTAYRAYPKTGPDVSLK